jgi:hypothetical protein
MKKTKQFISTLKIAKTLKEKQFEAKFTDGKLGNIERVAKKLFI